MNFNLSEEQTMIQDSIARFVQDNYELDQRNAVVAQEHGFSADHWQQFAELGWLSIPFAEEYGGFGGGPVDTMVIMQELGRGLVAEPFLPTVLLFGGLLQSGASEELKQQLIPQIIAGELQGAFAWVERQSRYEITDIRTRARQDGVDWLLNGEKTVVLNGGAAQKLIVAARTSGDQADQGGITLFLVDAAASGVERTVYRMTDGREAANVSLTDVRAEAVVGSVGEGDALMAPVVDNAILAVSADALGAMQSLNAQTLEYLKTRKQFGVHIGSFQALQHRMVDLFAACENTRSLLYRAVCAFDAGDEDAARSLLALKVMVGRAGRKVGGEAIQMHGGGGVCDDYGLAYAYANARTLRLADGPDEVHRDQIARLEMKPYR